jgi:hypothetical protein
MIVVIIACCVYADRGSIPFKPHVKIFEPEQRALIAWDGDTEILLLSTDLRASESTRVLEVIPLPSEPKVKKGDIEAFTRAIDLINSKISYRFSGEKRSLDSENAYKHRPPAGRVTFHQKIGPHDISVTQVLNCAGFIRWVERYLRSMDVENPRIPAAMKEVVEDYLEDGFDWFVFDIVSLDEETKTNDAIQYSFKSDFLFYPMRITKTETGFTSVQLIIISPRLLSNFYGISYDNIKLLHEPVDITAEELLQISRDMYGLLRYCHGFKLRIWEIQGELSSFDHDLIVK